MASAALSTRLTTTRLNCSRSMLTGGRPGARSVVQANAVQPAREDGSARPRPLSLRSLRHGLGGGEAGELREFVHQRLHGSPPTCRWSRRIRGRSAPDSGGVRAAVDLARDALGGKRDGGERVLDFVRDAARHLVPGGGLLRAQQFAGILEHDHEAGGELLFERGDRDGEMQVLRAPCAAPSGGKRRRCGGRASSGT